MARYGISSKIEFTRKVIDVKSPRQSPLLQPEQSGIRYFVKGPITEQLRQWLVLLQLSGGDIPW